MIIITTASANPQTHKKNTAFPPRNKRHQPMEYDEDGDGDDYVGGGGEDAVVVLVLSGTLSPSLVVRTDPQFPPTA